MTSEGTVRPWEGPHRPDDATVRRILRAQHPGLEADVIRYFAEGWDFTVFEVDGRWMARFPKREGVCPGIPRERRVLEALEALEEQVAAPLPAQRLYGEPSEAFPLPFVVHRKLPGVPLDTLGLGDVGPEATARLGRTVGALLAALHALPTALLEGADGDDEGMDDWLSDAKSILARIENELPRASFEGARQRLEHPPPPPARRVVTHSDLGPEHLLVDPATHVLTGVIDWEDAGLWEAAGDFVGLWAELGEAGLAAALDAYGRAEDHDLAARVRFHATRWMIHQVKTSEDGWHPDARDRWIARITQRLA